jgi:hypothetical protein
MKGNWTQHAYVPLDGSIVVLRLYLRVGVLTDVKNNGT